MNYKKKKKKKKNSGTKIKLGVAPPPLAIWGVVGHPPFGHGVVWPGQIRDGEPPLRPIGVTRPYPRSQMGVAEPPSNPLGHMGVAEPSQQVWGWFQPLSWSMGVDRLPQSSHLATPIWPLRGSATPWAAGVAGHPQSG